MSTFSERARLDALVRDVPDFPKPGITFKDITPLLADAAGFALAIDSLATKVRSLGVKAVVGIESRGFIIGAPVARALGTGFVPVRKPGKLPARTHRVDYALEYGSDALEMHHDAMAPHGHGVAVLIVDDVLATGGTAKATAELVRSAGGVVAGFAFLLELSFLNGRTRLGHGAAAPPVVSLLAYP
jgi:adenine phosphoribosyltransferase